MQALPPSTHILHVFCCSSFCRQCKPLQGRSFERKESERAKSRLCVSKNPAEVILTKNLGHLTKQETTAESQVQRSNSRGINDESVFDVALGEALVRVIDLVSTDELNVADNVVSSAEVQHLLGL